MSASSGTTLTPDANNTGGTIPLSPEGYAPNEGAQGIEDDFEYYTTKTVEQEDLEARALKYINIYDDGVRRAVANGAYQAGALGQHPISTIAERDRVVKIITPIKDQCAVYPVSAWGVLNDILTQITNGGAVEGNDNN